MTKELYKTRTSREKSNDRIRETMRAEIWNIKVGKGYYSFMYRTQRNGKWTAEYGYDSSHSRAPATMRKYLKNGGAVDIIMESRF